MKIDRAFTLSVAVAGATSIVTQIVVLREFLSAFYGNELVLGIILANWMLLTGVGSLLGRYAERVSSRITLLILLLLLAGFLPACTVLFLRILRNVLFPVGGTVGLLGILYSSFLLLAPYCLVSGILFGVFALTLSEFARSNLIARVYAYEAVGSVVGGLLFSLVLLNILQTFGSLLVLAAVMSLAAFMVSLRHPGNVLRMTAAALCLAALTAGFMVDLDGWTKAFLFRGQRLLYYKDTPYGSITVTAQGDQKNFFEDNVLLCSTNDVMLNEESVHYAMVQHPDPRTVLLLSGGVSGMTDEILKYGVDRIDYVEINPWLIDIGRKYTAALSNAKVRVVNEDGRLFVRNTRDHYDVVLMNVPEPGTAQLNRFYTMEFFRDLRRITNEGAVVSLSLTSSADYLSGEARMVRSILYNTLRASFRHVLVVPGGKDYFLASDNELHIDVSRLIEKRNVSTLYVNRYYIDDDLLKQRGENIVRTLNASDAVNTDFAPVAYYRQIIYWLSQFNFSPWIIVAVTGILLVIIAARVNIITFGIMTGGFAASSIEVILLISFQILCGYVYQMTGLLITLFMGGLAVGSYYAHRILPAPSMRTYALLLGGVALYAALLPVLLLFLQATPLRYGIVHAVFFLAIVVVAVLTGAQFSVAADILRGRVASVAADLYGIDLLGSAVGALVVGAILLPLLGITNVCLVIGALSLGSGCIAYVRGGRSEPAASGA